MTSKLIITAAITGAETTKAYNPNLPITPEEQAQSSYQAMCEGASIIHLHVRDKDGKPSQKIEDFKIVIEKIREKCGDIIIQISTGGAVGESIENRMAPLILNPEMASLNVGTLNFGDEIFTNSLPDIKSIAMEIKKQKIVPEIEVYDAGMVETALNLIKNGIIKSPAHFQFVLGVKGGLSGEFKNLQFLVDMLPKEHTWAVAGIGKYELPLSTMSILMGGHIRVGFEDNIFYSKGILAKSNAELVKRVADLAKILGRDVATVKEARKMLLYH